MLAEDKCSEVTWLLDCESIINNKLLHQMAITMKCPALGENGAGHFNKKQGGQVESSLTNDNARDLKEKKKKKREKKKKTTQQLHWLTGRLTNSEECSFSSATLQGDMFSIKALRRSPFIHWHPLALPGLPLAIHGHAHLPGLAVRNLGLLCCCCFCQECRGWSKAFPLGWQGCAPLPACRHASTRLQPAHPPCACISSNTAIHL